MKFIVMTIIIFTLQSCSSLPPRRVYNECKARLDAQQKLDVQKTLGAKQNKNPTYDEYYEEMVNKTKPPIKELKYFVDSQNSAGLVHVGGMFINNSNKTIKYLWLTFDHYNRVGDKVAGRIYEQSRSIVKMTGPVYPGGTGDQLYTDTYYIKDILCVVPTNVKIQYMDGSKKSISGTKLKNIIYKDYPRNVDSPGYYHDRFGRLKRMFPANCPWIYSKKEKEIFNNHPEPKKEEESVRLDTFIYDGFNRWDMSKCSIYINQYEKGKNN